MYSLFLKYRRPSISEYVQSVIDFRCGDTSGVLMAEITHLAYESLGSRVLICPNRVRSMALMKMFDGSRVASSGGSFP